jgi:hypothetical protein
LPGSAEIRKRLSERMSQLQPNRRAFHAAVTTRHVLIAAARSTRCD